MEQFLERFNKLWLAILCLGAFIVVYYSPVNYGDSDPRGTLMTSQAILQLHTVALDVYGNVAKGYQYGTGRQGHIYYGYPLGAVVYSLPFVFVANLRGQDMQNIDDDRQVQKWIAAIIVALASILIYLLCCCYVDTFYSILLSIAFVFGSSIASTTGSALWSVDFETLSILACLLLLVYAEQQKIKRINPILMGFLLFSTYLCRPTASVFVACILVYLFFKHRAIVVQTAIVSAVLVVGLVAVYLRMYRKPFSPYYGGVAFYGPPMPLFLALYGQLLSPSRGVLVFCPFLVISIVGAVVFFRQLSRSLLFWTMLVWVALHLILICLNPNFWGGSSYGNRLFADAFPGAILLSLLVWRCIVQSSSVQWRRVATGLLLVCTVLAVFINTAQGLYNPYSAVWNYGLDVGDNWHFVFDWKHPQFLASPQMIFSRDMDKLQPYVNVKLE